MFYHGNNFKKSYSFGGGGGVYRVIHVLIVDAPTQFKLYNVAHTVHCYPIHVS
jgi:hypothetical protein